MRKLDGYLGLPGQNMLAQVSEKRQMKKMYEKIILERPSSWLPSSWLHYTDALQNNLEMLHDWVNLQKLHFLMTLANIRF